MLSTLQLTQSARNPLLASCPWGPVTANGVDLLTEMYVIYMERNTSPLCPLGAAWAGVTDAWKEGRKARKYIMIHSWGKDMDQQCSYSNSNSNFWCQPAVHGFKFKSDIYGLNPNESGFGLAHHWFGFCVKLANTAINWYDHICR